jgi:hypothetical protein
MTDELPEFSFDIFREQLNEVVLTTINKIDREAPPRLQNVPGAAVMFESLLRSAELTYRTIRYLVADVPPEPARKLEFALSVPPLTRTLLDTLFTIVFTFDDLPERVRWYYKSGWREAIRRHRRLEGRYGSDERWKRWLAESGEHLESTRRNWGITEDEASGVVKIRWWPNPGKMAEFTGLSPERHDHLMFLNDWFYRELSAQSHLSAPGLIYRATPLLPMAHDDPEERRRRLMRQKSDMFVLAATLLLACVSEVECELRFGTGGRMRYVWGILMHIHLQARDLYEQRYDRCL